MLLLFYPPFLPHIYSLQEAETRTIVPLIYLDWLSRSPLAYEIFGSNKRTSYAPNFEHLNSDIENEQHLPRQEQIELINYRIRVIGECLTYLIYLSATFKPNFLHKVLLVQAECARVSLIMGSNAIFCPPNQPAQKQDFEEAIGLYEAAIQSANEHNFAQYKATGLELYGRFWLTAPSLPKDNFACGYLAEAIFVCEKWGAVAKAQSIRTTYSAVLSTMGGYTTNSEVVKTKKPLSNTTCSLDLETVVQASQTISNEVWCCGSLKVSPV